MTEPQKFDISNPQREALVKLIAHATEAHVALWRLDPELSQALNDSVTNVQNLFGVEP